MLSQEMDRLVLLAKELWPRFTPTPTTGEAWGLMVGHHAYDEVKAALIVHRRDSEEWQPDIGQIAKLCEPEREQLDDVIAVCNMWYRGTDDLNRLPNREDRERYPLAYKTWCIAGGYEALHDQVWAHQRLRSAYTEALEATASHEAHGLHKAITSGEAATFMQELNRRRKELSA